MRSVFGVETEVASESDEGSDGTSDHSREAFEDRGDCEDVYDVLVSVDILRLVKAAGSVGMGLLGCDVRVVGHSVCGFEWTARLRSATDCCCIINAVLPYISICSFSMQWVFADAW